MLLPSCFLRHWFSIDVTVSNLGNDKLFVLNWREDVVVCSKRLTFMVGSSRSDPGAAASRIEMSMLQVNGCKTERSFDTIRGERGGNAGIEKQRECCADLKQRSSDLQLRKFGSA
jgi:hypothetical protein